jgi:thermitase
MSRTFRIKMLVVMALATVFSNSFAAPKQDHARGRLIIETKAGLSEASLDTILKPHGGKKKKLGQSHLYMVSLPNNASETAVANMLARNPALKFAELDQKVQINASSNDPYLGNLWHLPKVGAMEAWDVTQGAGVTIAILDSGVLTTHPDLIDNMVGGYNTVDQNTNVADVCGHGTAVAGVAAATVNNATGVAGIAGKSKIMPIRIAHYDSTNGCYAYFSTVASGLIWAADNGARVANVSYSGVGGSSSVMSAANYMKSKGGLVFISAGNSNIDENVTNDGSMNAVSATDSNNNKAYFSSWGNFVTLAAPGVGIMTTNRSGGYSSWNGTSFSSPLVSGVAALVMSARPELTGDQVQSILFSTATDLGAAGKDPIFGYGMVNAADAVIAARNFVIPKDTTAPTVSVVKPGNTVSGLVSVTVNANDNVGVTSVDLMVNGTVVTSDTTSPFVFSWDSTTAANGTAVLRAIAYDAAGNAGTSAPVSVNVSNMTSSVPNDTTPPVVTINNPVSGSVSGNVSISVSATDNAGPAGLTLVIEIDDVVKAQGTGGSLSSNWNTKKVKSGWHTITATAKDASGNISESSVSVYIR